MTGHEPINIPAAEYRDQRRNTQNAQRVAAGRKPIRFWLTAFADIEIDPSPDYLIRDMLPREGLAVVWGPPKCGKSFWTYDALMHVARGISYRGRRVERGPVVYIACEGERGLGNRSVAYRTKHCLDDADPPFFNMTTKLNLPAQHDELIADIRAQLEPPDQDPVRPVAVCIDTLNRSIAGSESSDEDMSAYVKAADEIRAAFNCLVVVVHHCGIDDKRPRGHTSLTGAADAQLAVKRDISGLITVTVEYAKDFASDQAVTSRLEVVDLGTNTKGEPITSCVITDAEGEMAAEKGAKRLTGAIGRALDLLRNAGATAGEQPPVNSETPNGVRAVRETVWRDYCYKGGIAASGDPGAKRQAFNRARSQLQDRRLIRIWDDWVWEVPGGA